MYDKFHHRQNKTEYNNQNSNYKKQQRSSYKSNKSTNLSITAFLASDSTNELLTREYTVTQYNEASVCHLAHSFPFICQTLTDQLQFLASLGKIRTGPVTVRFFIIITTVTVYFLLGLLFLLLLLVFLWVLSERERCKCAARTGAEFWKPRWA